MGNAIALRDAPHLACIFVGTSSSFLDVLGPVRHAVPDFGFIYGAPGWLSISFSVSVGASASVSTSRSIWLKRHIRPCPRTFHPRLGFKSPNESSLVLFDLLRCMSHSGLQYSCGNAAVGQTKCSRGAVCLGLPLYKKFLALPFGPHFMEIFGNIFHAQLLNITVFQWLQHLLRHSEQSTQ